MRNPLSIKNLVWVLAASQSLFQPQQVMAGPGSEVEQVPVYSLMDRMASVANLVMSQLGYIQNHNTWRITQSKGQGYQERAASFDRLGIPVPEALCAPEDLAGWQAQCHEKDYSQSIEEQTAYDVYVCFHLSRQLGENLYFSGQHEAALDVSRAIIDFLEQLNFPKASPAFIETKKFEACVQSADCSQEDLELDVTMSSPKNMDAAFFANAWSEFKNQKNFFPRYASFLAMIYEAYKSQDCQMMSYLVGKLNHLITVGKQSGKFYSNGVVTGELSLDEQVNKLNQCAEQCGNNGGELTACGMTTFSLPGELVYYPVSDASNNNDCANYIQIANG